MNLNRNTKEKASQRSRLPDSLQAWFFPLTVLLLWQVAGSLLLPTPWEIGRQFIILVANGTLFSHLEASVIRAAAGFVLGSSIALIIGLAAGLSKLLEELLDPSLQMMRTVPLLSLIPLFILWFGVGQLSQVLLIALGSFFPLYVNTFAGVRGVDRKLYEVAQILEYSKMQRIFQLIIPAALPNILLGFRLSLGIAWLCLVVAELMGASSGVGYMIGEARQYSQTAAVFVGIGVFAAVGKLSDSLVRMLESRLLRWRDAYKG
ncbi:sulfonate transport system permease protein [Fontibacillus panacisegetis]|uniref:Sulfonate transport system permease protein n=1 Tax=Fontibacillus panacisegetis TaxID=670482 RepID=A0A1G7G455_9BACL|nr:ABC transporter permease [Fontibacillus panacisegetis]SDE82880.1 sulfonate transport system permease protein [Fontibacillus panacisegetis]